MELRTNSGRSFKVVPNYSKRSFTIYTVSGRFRTVRMSKQEFNECLNNTGNDWQNFLMGQDYYKVA
jgi:hypothetical protein